MFRLASGTIRKLRETWEFVVPPRVEGQGIELDTPDSSKNIVEVSPSREIFS